MEKWLTALLYGLAVVLSWHAAGLVQGVKSTFEMRKGRLAK